MCHFCKTLTEHCSCFLCDASGFAFKLGAIKHFWDSFLCMLESWESQWCSQYFETIYGQNLKDVSRKEEKPFLSSPIYHPSTSTDLDSYSSIVLFGNFKTF